MRSLIKHVLKRSEPTDDLHVAGWVRTRRDSKTFSFLELNDGTCLGNLQIVADAGIPGYEAIAKMSTGASIEVRGKLIPSPAAGQDWEMQASSLKQGASARAINQNLGRTGSLWQAETFDHIVRSEAQLDHYRRYIAENPCK
ncbi:MAG TPA: OB-fold nucleic acid binding domain-containing protein, partial [Luteolibacter sp.]